MLKAGDIVVAVDGVALGPCLQVLDSVVDKSRNDFVTVEVFRNGELKKIKVETYDMEQYRIKRFIDFSSTKFFQSDELYSLRTGIPIGELTFYRYRNSTTFDKLKAVQFGDSRLFVIRGLEFDNEPISNLNAFAKKAPELIKKKNLTIKYRYLIPEINYLSEFYDGTYCDGKIISFVSIDENAKDCFEYSFDPSSNTWKKSVL